MLPATDTDLLSASAGISRLRKITNKRVRELMGITHTITDAIKNDWMNVDFPSRLLTISQGVKDNPVIGYCRYVLKLEVVIR